MACDIQALLTNGRCLAGAPAGVSGVLWCQAGEAISGAVSDHPALLSDDGNWYEIRAVDGGETIQIGPQVAGPDVNEYWVLVDLTDGLKRKFSLVGTGDNVEWEIDPATTLEAETPATVYSGGTPFSVSTVDEGTTIELNPV